MVSFEPANTLDILVAKTKTALDMWLTHPNSRELQQEFRNANQAVLDFSRLHRESER